MAAARADALIEALSDSGQKVTLTVVTEEAVLTGEATDGVGHMGDGPGLAPETVRRLACDADVIRITHNRTGDVKDIGRESRRPSAGLRRAVLARDGGWCAFPGCTNRRTEIHHVVHWADAGPTDLHNLLSLCGVHHRLHHERHFEIAQNGHGGFVFRTPDGRLLPNTYPLPPADGRAVELPVDAFCAMSNGARLNVSGVVEGLLQADRRRSSKR